MKKRILNNVYKNHVAFKFSDTAKKLSHETLRLEKNKHSEKTKKAVEILKMNRNNFKVKKSFPKESSGTTTGTVPVPCHRCRYYYDKYGIAYYKISPDTNLDSIRKLQPMFCRQALVDEKEGSIKKELGFNTNQLNHPIPVSREPCSILGDTSQAVSNADISETPLKENNNQNEKMPISLESQGFLELKKFQKNCSSDIQDSNVQNSNVTQEEYNEKSGQQQSMLSTVELSDLISPGETNDLNRGCIPCGQLSVRRLTTSNSISSHQLPTRTVLSSDKPLEN